MSFLVYLIKQYVCPAVAWTCRWLWEGKDPACPSLSPPLSAVHAHGGGGCPRASECSARNAILYIFFFSLLAAPCLGVSWNRERRCGVVLFVEILQTPFRPARPGCVACITCKGGSSAVAVNSCKAHLFKVGRCSSRETCRLKLSCISQVKEQEKSWVYQWKACRVWRRHI